MKFGPIDVAKLQTRLERIVGPRRTSVAPADKRTYTTDMWPRLLIQRQHNGAIAASPHIIVWPISVREIVSIVRVAIDMQVPIVPYGGGSGVCGGAVPLYGGITVDMKRMNRLQDIDTTGLTCNVEAGINGEQFERALEKRGVTFGNFPSSIYCSTVGGWLATRAAGQMSSKYGKTEDRVLGITAVLGTGDVITTDQDPSRNADWAPLLVGSEGTLAIICSARLRLSPSPRLRLFRGYEFSSVPQGLEAIRTVMQSGYKPSVLRLYNEFDTLLHHRKKPTLLSNSTTTENLAFPDVSTQPSSQTTDPLASLWKKTQKKAMQWVLGNAKWVQPMADTLTKRFTRSRCLLIAGLEGGTIRTQSEANLVFRHLSNSGGKDLGEKPGKDWFAGRYNVSYKMSGVFRAGAFVDTMEIAAPWHRINDVYKAVHQALHAHAIVFAHFSHAYQDGCSIYFTFSGFKETQKETLASYDALWRDGMMATIQNGGTISHHHGIGIVKAKFMHEEHRESFALFQKLKTVCDPHGIMNPGKMGL